VHPHLGQNGGVINSSSSSNSNFAKELPVHTNNGSETEKKLEGTTVE
jgi:hypothetical protein